MKAHELLSDESKWTRGASARDAQGRPVSPHFANAVRFCLTGAIAFIYGNTSRAAHDQLCRIAEIVNESVPRMWNDAPERTFQEVRDLLIKLDI